MSIELVLFDLDGTLLPMDNDEFTRGYFKLLVKKLAAHGYDPGKLIDSIWSGVAAMVKNDGSCRNEDAFWARFVDIYGPGVLDDKPVFEEFYAVDFSDARVFCGFAEKAAQAVRLARSLGLRTALASTYCSAMMHNSKQRSVCKSQSIEDRRESPCSCYEKNPPWGI